VSPRSRVVAITAASAAIAAAAVVGVVALQTGPTPEAASGPATRPGPPPLTLDLGIRTDREARALRLAAADYRAGRGARAAREFARWRSIEARVGEAFARWPDETVDRLNRLAGLHPDRAVVQLNLGVALYWSGLAGAEDAWRQAAADEPDTAYAVAAGNLLHPEYAPGVPVFVSTAALPAGFDELTPPAQLATLERGAARDVPGKLLYGAALQRLGRTRSAERVFAAAAKQAPRDVEARVADAVGRFDKSRPAAAFSRLGPLTRTFPDKATVRFHLGLLLLWSGETREAKRQLRRAIAVEPGSPLAEQARRYLAELHKAGI
jgi:tetratricopeptide (TPR) repeat protein